MVIWHVGDPTEHHRPAGRMAVGHGCKPPTMSLPDWRRLVRRLLAGTDQFMPGIYKKITFVMA
jgi:hypothetical protein